MDLFGFLFSQKQQREIWPLIVDFLTSINYRDQLITLSENLANNFEREQALFVLSIPQYDGTISLIRPNFHIDEIVESNKQIFLDLLQSRGMLDQYNLYQSQPKRFRGLNL
jgi:hypothetical protein